MVFIRRSEDNGTKRVITFSLQRRERRAEREGGRGGMGDELVNLSACLSDERISRGREEGNRDNQMK